MNDERYIVMWRKTGEQCLDWDFYVAFSLDEAKKVIENIKKDGVWQYSTSPLGNRIPELCSE